MLRRYWTWFLVPFLLVLVLIGALLALTESSALAPFLYFLF
jgi:hypothetical protein